MSLMNFVLFLNGPLKGSIRRVQDGAYLEIQEVRRHARTGKESMFTHRYRYVERYEGPQMPTVFTARLESSTKRGR